MASVTSPDNIAYWTNSDPTSIVAQSAAQAASIQAALNMRQNYHFRWADSTARNAQTGMVFGNSGFQLDTGTEYLFNGSSWQIWNKPLTAFTPSLSGINVGTGGTNTATWSVSSGRAFVQGQLILGSASFTVGTTRIGLPATSVSMNAYTPLGGASLRDSNGAVNLGVVAAVGGSTTTVGIFANRVSGSNVEYNELTSTLPFTWAATDYIPYSYSYLLA